MTKQEKFNKLIKKNDNYKSATKYIKKLERKNGIKRRDEFIKSNQKARELEQRFIRCGLTTAFLVIPCLFGPYISVYFAIKNNIYWMILLIPFVFTFLIMKCKKAAENGLQTMKDSLAYEKKYKGTYICSEELQKEIDEVAKLRERLNQLLTTDDVS